MQGDFNLEQNKRSECPINAAVEIIGDQWSLLILRDILLRCQGRFSDFYNADEGISTNILTARLNHLIGHGLIEKHPDPKDGRASLYLPTPEGVDLIPVLLSVMVWSADHMPNTTQYPEIIEAYRKDPHGATTSMAARAAKFRKDSLQ